MTMFKTKVVGGALSVLALALLGAGCEVAGQDEPALEEAYTAPSGVTLRVLSRGNLEGAAEIETEWRGEEDEYDIDGDETLDFVVVEITVAPGGQTGWHHHPGPVFFNVAAGAVSIYREDDPCDGEDVSAGDALMEATGHVERAINHGTTNAVVHGTFVTPPGGAFRIDAPAPAGSENCP